MRWEVSMRRGRVIYYLLSVGLILALASATYTSSSATTVTVESHVGADTVEQTEGLLRVSQTTRNFNSTTQSIDVTVKVTNQMRTTVDEVRVSVGGVTKSTERLAPGESDSVPFNEVSCTTTIQTMFTAGSLSVRGNAPVSCP